MARLPGGVPRAATGVALCLSAHMRVSLTQASCHGVPLACWEWEGVSNYGFTESRKPIGCSAGRRCSTTLVMTSQHTLKQTYGVLAGAPPPAGHRHREGMRYGFMSLCLDHEANPKVITKFTYTL